MTSKKYLDGWRTPVEGGGGGGGVKMGEEGRAGEKTAATDTGNFQGDVKMDAVLSELFAASLLQPHVFRALSETTHFTGTCNHMLWRA